MVNNAEKSVMWAYVTWFIGGIFGLHHFYLRRDRHAFIWWSTMGGLGLGWLGDLFRIPRYVKDANEDLSQIEALVKRMFQNKSPPFSSNRFSTTLLVGYTWGTLLTMAIPPDDVLGLNLRYLKHLVPFVIALGVWTVGNIGRECGDMWWATAAAYATYPLRYFIYDESFCFMLMVVASAVAFDKFSKKWRRTPPKRTNIIKRVVVLGVCCALYSSLWCSYLYYHGTVTDSDGDEIPLYEAVHHFFTSPWWLDVKQCILETQQFAQHHGWAEVWRQIIDLSDPRGEQNAYKVLELSPEASQLEITTRWRKLSRESHPDKARPGQRRAAQERFMEIQRAYEILSSRKHRRYRRNKKDNTDNNSDTIHI